MAYQTSLTLPKRTIRQIDEVGIPSRELDRIVSEYVAQRARHSKSGVIEISPADEGKERHQEGWIKFFNEHGQEMISVSRAYRAAQENSNAWLNNLGKYLRLKRNGVFINNFRLVTSTAIPYRPNSLDAKIIQNTRSTVVKSIKNQVIVPEYCTFIGCDPSEKRLSKVLSTSEGLQFLRTLFDTRDSAEDIANTVQRLSSASLKDIYVETPLDHVRRDSTQKGAVMLRFDHTYCNLDEPARRTFTIDCDGCTNYPFGEGISYGVSANPSVTNRLWYFLTQKLAA